MLLPAVATLYWYTLRSPMGSAWFSTKEPIVAKGTFDAVKGSIILGDAVKTVVVDPGFPMGVLVTATTAGGTRFSWHVSAPLDKAGDYPATVGLTGSLSVTIATPKKKTEPGRVTAKAVALDLGVSEYHAQRVLSSWRGYGVPKDVADRVRRLARKMGWTAGNLGSR